MSRRGWIAAACVGMAALAGADGREQRPPARVGIVRTLSQDATREALNTSAEGLGALMDTETGSRWESEPVKDAWALGQGLENGRLAFGVCNGFEFAWLHQRYPDLRPLAILVNREHEARAHVMVRADNPAQDFAALQGQSLAIAEGTKAFCTLFLDRACQKAGSDAVHYFPRTAKPATAQDALDDVVAGVVQVALVDTAGLNHYRQHKPKRAAQLREVAASPAFPPAVAIYRPASLEEPLRDRVRKALLQLDQDPRGREILHLWQATALEPVPEGYEHSLEEAAAAYPPPSGE